MTASRWNGHGGDGHDVLIAQVASFLKSLGYESKEPHQGQGEVAPDLTHLEGEAVVHDEIETEGGNPGQVRTNLEKALGKPVIFWTPGRLVTERVAGLLVGGSGFRIMVREENGQFTPLVSTSFPSPHEPRPGTPLVGPSTPAFPTTGIDHLRRQVSDKYEELVRAGKIIATPEGPGVRLSDLAGSESGLGEEGWGHILVSMGFRGVRAWDPNARKKIMVYVRVSSSVD